ncbi:MAG: acetate--CoA ligase family protein [Deltaproteobacteria bacterium]|nr:acetate--CoA ligase family protein [Deltaproteobacteria bacterium]
MIGASRDPNAIGHQVVTALKESGFPKPIYPVNPSANEIEGLPAFRSVVEIPNHVDLALIVVPAACVSQVIDDCVKKQVKAVVIVSAGFAELNEEGARLQRVILEKVRSHGIRMVGPNCFGVMNTALGSPMNASFSPNFPLTGNVAMASQSGGLGLAMLAFSRLFHVGLSYFVSLGNKADLSSNDLIEYWEHDPETKVILLYLESFGNPARFLQIARRVARTKPIIVLKSGRSTAGTRAACSHTAALAASDLTVDSLLHQAGVLRVETMEQMFHLSQALSSQPLPQGKNVAIVTNAGGPAILCTDACEALGLKVIDLSSQLKDSLRQALPPEVVPQNPLDLVASAGPEHFSKAIPVLVGSSEVDALIIIYTVIGKRMSSAILSAIQEGIATARGSAAKRKPIFLCWITEEVQVSPLKIGEETVPVYRFPEDATRSLAYMSAQSEWNKKPPGNYIPMGSKNEKHMRELIEGRDVSSRWLSPRHTLELLEASDFSVIRSQLVQSAQAAANAAREIGFPVALKLASKTISHKTEVGGVRLNLTDEHLVKDAFQTIESNLRRFHPEEPLESVQVQAMAAEGIELFIGMQRDPVFGPVIAFGLGGIHVEVLSDVRFRVVPVTDCDVREMVREIKGYKLLSGYRGKPESDIDAIEKLLLRAAWFAETNPEILSFDFNPVMAFPKGKGCRILDARLEVKPK